MGIIFTYSIISKSIQDHNSFLQPIKKLIPNALKTQLKETIFVFNNQKLLKEEIKRLKKSQSIISTSIYNQLDAIIEKNQIVYNSPKKDDYFKNLRNRIINDFIFDEKIISLKKDSITRNFKEYEKYSVEYYDLFHHGLFKVDKKNKNLLIYNQGHGGEPFEYQYYLDLEKKFFQNNYDVLSLSMTGIGYNEVNNFKVTWPTRNAAADSNNDKKIYSYGEDIKNFKNHDYFEEYFDPNFPGKKPLGLMLSGNYYLIQNILKKKSYDNIVMMGISGGAWVTTIMSSIIPEIKESFAYSSSGKYVAFNVPIILSWRRDWESIDSELYSYADYDDFYNLATLDKDFKSTRFHFQVFEGESAPVNLLKKLNDKNPVKNFKILSLKKKDLYAHTIDTEHLFKKFGF